MLAIEIGGTKLQIARGDPTGRIKDAVRFPVEIAEGAEGIRRRIQSVVTAWQRDRRFAGVGVGFGGPVDRSSGTVSRSYHVEGWNGFPLAEWLHDLTGAPVGVENDANVAALAEARLGRGAGASPVFYTNQGSGVGGGLVVDGELYHGAIPGEVEFGHLRLDRTGTILQDRCSGHAVDARVRAAIAADPAGGLARLAASHKPGAEAKLLRPALEANEPVALAILEEAASDLALALSHVTHLFHPEIIVLGGGLSLLGEPWRAAVAAALPAHVMQAFAPGPSVALAALGEEVVLVGALLLAAGLPTRTDLADWLSHYVSHQKTTIDSIPLPQVGKLSGLLRDAVDHDRQIFVFGNGGSAASASHFATDLGKGASDRFGKRFRVLSLNDNASWMTALANDYAYEDVFVRQLENYARPGDVALTMSVSGNSPSCVRAIAWAREHGLRTVALVGGGAGQLADIAEIAIPVDSTHYGRTEDAHMTICHMLAYAFMELEHEAVAS